MARYVSREQFASEVAAGKHPADVLLRKQFIADDVKAPEQDTRRRTFCISTGAVDRDNDTISPSGWDLDNFRRNPVVLFAHDYKSLPIGKAVDLRLEAGRLYATAEFAQHPMAETVLQLVDGGFLRATSVGFRPKAFIENQERRGIDFQEQELLEFSIVPVPANPEALIEARDAGIDLRPLKEWADGVSAVLKGASLAEEMAEAVLDEQVARQSRSPMARLKHVLLSVPNERLKDLRSALVRAKTDEEAQAAVAEVVTGEPAGDAPANTEPLDPSKPYPNEHACRLADPGKFSKFRRGTRKHEGKTYSVIYGQPKAGGSWQEQAYRYAKDAWTAAEARTHCKAHDGTFEPAGQAAAPPGGWDGCHASGPDAQMDEDPIRWNRSLSKAFDVAGEPLQPALLAYDWIGKFLEVPLADVHESSVVVGGARMGAFLTALDETLAGWQVLAARNITRDGSEAPPEYEKVRLNSTLSRDFMVEGLRFCARAEGEGDRLVAGIMRTWSGVKLVTYVVRGHEGASQSFVGDVLTRAAGINYLKGEAFSLSGEFLTRGGETWADLFLPEVNEKPLRRAVDVLNAEGASMDPRGVLLMGPPGTGKTLAGRVMMSQAKATFIWLAARDFWRAGAMGGLTSAFDLASECAPAIVFIEDIDSWLGAESIDLLKTEMDGLKRRRGVVTVLTTNYPELLPKALVDRPGRFHDVLNLSLPDEAVRARMLSAWLGDRVDAATVSAFAKQTEGLSGAHLRELVNFAGVIAREEDCPLSAALVRALEKVQAQRELVGSAAVVRRSMGVATFMLKGLGACGPRPDAAVGGATMTEKAGRVLSRANESKLAQAVKLLEEVLAQVQQQPAEPPEDEGEKDKPSFVGSCCTRGCHADTASTCKSDGCGHRMCAEHTGEGGECPHHKAAAAAETAEVLMLDEEKDALTLDDERKDGGPDALLLDDEQEVDFDAAEVRALVRATLRESLLQAVGEQTAAALDKMRGRVE